MAPWIGGGVSILLFLLPCFLLLRIGGNDPLGPLRVVSYYKARMFHGQTVLLPCVVAEAGSAYPFGIGGVGNVVPFEAHWRVSGLGAPWMRCCLQTVGLRQRDWHGFRFWGGVVERGRLGGGEAINNA